MRYARLFGHTFPGGASSSRRTGLLGLKPPSPRWSPLQPPRSSPEGLPHLRPGRLLAPQQVVDAINQSQVARLAFLGLSCGSAQAHPKWQKALESLSIP